MTLVGVLETGEEIYIERTMDDVLFTGADGDTYLSMKEEGIDPENEKKFALDGIKSLELATLNPAFLIEYDLLVKNDEEEVEEEVPEEPDPSKEADFTPDELKKEEPKESVSRKDEAKFGVDYSKSLKVSLKKAQGLVKDKQYPEAAEEFDNVADDATDAAKALRKMKRDADSKEEKEKEAPVKKEGEIKESIDVDDLSAEQIQAIVDNCESVDTNNSRFEDMYDQMLDEVGIDTSQFDASRILKEIDPTAYRCGANDYLDSLMGDDLTIQIDGTDYWMDEAEEAVEELV